MLRFDGRVAVVTGAGNGLGREYALLLGSRGCKVVVNDLGGSRDGGGASSRAADLVVEEIRKGGGEAVANYDSVEFGDRIIDTAIKNYGRIDIVINNAGILRDKAFVNMTEEEFDIIHKIHVKGSYYVTKAAWPYMRQQNYGKVIMTASAAGIFGNFGQTNYSAAKLGLLGMSNTLAIEGRKYNICVNTVIPAAASRLTEDIMPAEIFEKLKPQFVSPVTVWLCHEDCHETGGCFEAAGGYVAKYQFFRSVGKAFIDKPLTLENLRDHWSEVVNLKGAGPLASIQEQTLSVVQKLSGGEPMKSSLEQDTQPEGREEDTSIFRYDFDSAILYHLAVGVSTRDPDHLRFLYENAEDFSVVPSFAVIPPMNAVFQSKELHDAIARVNGNPARMLHGEQYIELYKPLPPEATVKTDVRIGDVLDKGSGAVVIIEAETKDARTGEPLCRTQWLLFFVGAGNFGGPRSSNKVVPTAEIPSRQPDATMEDRTSIDQAALYRLCGDKNPLHIDPTFAAMGGWKQPIMHGLCSLGYSTRHVMKTFANNDMTAFKSLKVRFTGPVLPGETVRTRMWKDGSRVLFDTISVESGKTVIGGGVIELRNPGSVSIPRPGPQSGGVMAEGGELKTEMVFEGMRFRVEEQPDLVNKIKAIYEYNITQDGKTVAVWTLDLKNGQGAVYKGACKDEKPNVVVTISDDDMFNMAVGQLDPQKAFMTGKLKVRGNIMLMQKLRLLLKPPAEKKTEEPVAEAAPASSSTDDLHCKKIFSNTNAKIGKNPSLASEIKTIYQFDVLKDGKVVYQYTLDLKNGEGCGYEGPAKEKPDSTLIMEDAVLDQIFNGKLDAQRAFMSQKLKIKGDVLASQKLAEIWAADEQDESDEPTAPVQAASTAQPSSAGLSSLMAPQGSPKTVKADFIFNIFLYHMRQDPEMGEYITGLVKCMYHWVILQKGQKASEWTCDLKIGKGDLYHEAPRGGVKPEVQITIDDEDLVLLMLGKLNPQKAFMQGRLKVRGNIMLMQKFNTLWQEILKSGRIVELKMMTPLLSDGKPLSSELWSDYQFYKLTQRLAHLPDLVKSSQGRAYHFNIKKGGDTKSDWTIDLGSAPGAVYRGAPKGSSQVCEIAIDDLAVHHLVEGTLPPQAAFAEASVNDRSAVDTLMPLFLSKSKL